MQLYTNQFLLLTFIDRVPYIVYISRERFFHLQKNVHVAYYVHAYIQMNHTEFQAHESLFPCSNNCHSKLNSSW